VKDADEAEARRNDRSPMYCNDNPKYRIVNRHGRWLVQFNTGAYATRENDPWIDVSPLMDDRASAESVMATKAGMAPRI
jgi:hypothetical protein